MRQNTRAEIAAIVQRQLAPVNDYLAKLMAALAGVSNEMAAAIEKIQPASVDLTQEMADDIVRKIHGPLTIGQGFSDWIKQEAQYHDVLMVNRLGFSSSAGDMQVTLKTNGTLTIEMRDALGSRIWFGTFIPPDFGVPDATG